MPALRNICPQCEGTGRALQMIFIPCPVCQGRGYLLNQCIR